MPYKTLTVIAVLVVSLFVFVVRSTPVSANKSSTSPNQPPKGATCTVEFKRDLLGVQSQYGISPNSGSVANVKGQLVDATSEWIVIKPGESEQVWIPREAVLLLVVSKVEKS